MFHHRLYQTEHCISTSRRERWPRFCHKVFWNFLLGWIPTTWFGQPGSPRSTNFLRTGMRLWSLKTYVLRDDSFSNADEHRATDVRLTRLLNNARRSKPVMQLAVSRVPVGLFRLGALIYLSTVRWFPLVHTQHMNVEAQPRRTVWPAM